MLHHQSRPTWQRATQGHAFQPSQSAPEALTGFNPSQGPVPLGFARPDTRDESVAPGESTAHAATLHQGADPVMPMRGILWGLGLSVPLWGAFISGLYFIVR